MLIFQPFGTWPGEYRSMALAAVILLILTEALWLRLHNKPGYDWRETATSTALLGGQVVARLLSAGLVTPLMLWVYQHRLFTLNLDDWATIAGLFFGAEFLYYGFHRASHRLRWLWASHHVHHSATRLNFSAAYRLGWTQALSGGWLFFVPIIWLGYYPATVMACLAFNLGFQFFLHTETIGRLGPLEWIFNTPSHHRVHHATNPELLDRNFGGVLILFDRLFGTYAEEPDGQALHYGLAGASLSFNPVRIALGEWMRLLRDVLHAKNLREAWRASFGRV